MSEKLQDHEILERDERSIEEVFLARVGKVKQCETYSNSSQFLIMFQNDISIVVKEQTKKHASVNIYYGVGEVTHKYFKTSRSARKVKAKIVQALITRLEGETEEDLHNPKRVIQFVK